MDGEMEMGECIEFLRNNRFIDYVVHGEGEKVFLDLVESFENKNTEKRYGDPTR